MQLQYVAQQMVQFLLNISQVILYKHFTHIENGEIEFFVYMVFMVGGLKKETLAA
jgi:hypothetical protein